MIETRPESEQHRRASLLRARAAERPLWIPVDGVSMGSSIRGGGRVLVAADEREPRRGEIWAFEGPGSILVHRFRGSAEGQYWFRGDANLGDDDPVRREALVGRVIEIDDEHGRRQVDANDRRRGRLRLDLLSARRWLRRVSARLRHRMQSRFQRN